MSKFLLTLEATGSREDLEKALEMALDKVRNRYIECDEESFSYTISTINQEIETEKTFHKKPACIFDFDLSPVSN